VFYLGYLASELRRRKGRTFLTALGLGVGVGLVVAVSALSDGLDKAQDEVLEPLTGVGTDLTVARPLDISDDVDGGGGGLFGNLSQEEQERLREENGGGRLRLDDLGEPGDSFKRTDFVTTTQLSFPESEVGDVAHLDGAESAAGGLTLTALQISGKVPEPTGGRRITTPGGGAPPDDIDFDSSTVSGVDQRRPSLGAIAEGQVTQGSYLSQGNSREAILNVGYARRKDIEVGESFSLKGRKFEVVGLASPPLGGQASDIYVKLDQLQRMSDRQGRVNTIYVRADSADDVAALSAEIARTFAGSQVTTAQDLADRVGGSLADAKDLAGKLGTALTVVALLAAFLIASLLTLSSVTKRVRELGTLKAVGWPQRLVVRQVTGEALAQGALGGLLGAALGVGAAALIGAVGPELEATVTQVSQPAPGPVPGGFGQGAVEAGSRLVTLDAPVDASLLLLAVGLALLGGLLAGAVGGARAARLRPADALRHID
jgi:ABC-type antimicrobial peptide transport system permease subunit